MSYTTHPKYSKVILFTSILLFACGVFAIWSGIAFILQDFPILALKNIWGILHLVIATFFIVGGYLVLDPESLQTGTLMALILGLVMTIWFTMTSAYGLALLLEGVLPLLAGINALREQKETRKKIWIRRIKGFWYDFSHNKIGLAGLAILLVYVVVAIFQPIIATHNPDETGLAGNLVMPEWVAILNPDLKDLPRTTDYYMEWNWTSLHPSVSVTKANDTWIIQYVGNLSTGRVVALLTAKFNYPYTPPKNFEFDYSWGAKIKFDKYRRATVRYSLEVNITRPDGEVIPFWDQHFWRFKAAQCHLPNPYYNASVDPPERRTYPGQREYEAYWHFKETIYAQNYTLQPAYGLYKNWSIPIPTWSTNEPYVHVSYTTTYYPCIRLGFESWQTEKMAEYIFAEKGEYTLQLYVTFEPISPDYAACNVTITGVELHIPGLLWGLLGTEAHGRDCWSRLVYGARVSLAVGIVSAVLSVSLGVLVGVVAGYYGGLLDEGLMRLVDILLCLPVLPLLLVLVALFGRSILYIILIIAIFGWQGLSRVIRSQVLSLREMPFIECARASGASPSYIMFRHLVPNVMPIAMASMILSIPGAILLEAALSYIGFGDPHTPTWGREFSYMQHSFAKPAEHWWWVLPPGIAITFLCVAFVFLGHAIDEIVNPRLRRRR